MRLDGKRSDAPGSLNRARGRRIFIQSSMRSDVVVVVLGIAGFGVDGPCRKRRYHPRTHGQPFGKAILPRWNRCGRLVPNTHRAQSTSDDAAAHGDHVFRRRLLCDVDPDEVSAVYPNDDQCIEEVETDRRDDEEIATISGAWLRKNVRHPWLGGCHLFHHVLADARRRDLKPEP